MPNVPSDWLDDLSEVSLQLDAAGGRVGIARERLYAIRDIAFVRYATEEWNGWCESQQQPPPIFNWISVYNFHFESNNHAFSIGNRLPTALMLVKDSHIVRCDKGYRPPLVYVSFLEVAPWHRPGAPAGRRCRGVGTAMLRAACDLSLQRGYDGRVGLHSVKSAENFYRRLGFRMLDCSNEYNEIYFELSETGAQALMSD